MDAKVLDVAGVVCTAVESSLTHTCLKARLVSDPQPLNLQRARQTTMDVSVLCTADDK
jgi:hypothetical protein